MLTSISYEPSARPGVDTICVPTRASILVRVGSSASSPMSVPASHSPLRTRFGPLADARSGMVRAATRTSLMVWSLRAPSHSRWRSISSEGWEAPVGWNSVVLLDLWVLSSGSRSLDDRSRARIQIPAVASSARAASAFQCVISSSVLVEGGDEVATGVITNAPSQDSGCPPDSSSIRARSIALARREACLHRRDRGVLACRDRGGADAFEQAQENRAAVRLIETHDELHEPTLTCDRQVERVVVMDPLDLGGRSLTRQVPALAASLVPM